VPSCKAAKSSTKSFWRASFLFKKYSVLPSRCIIFSISKVSASTISSRFTSSKTNLTLALWPAGLNSLPLKIKFTLLSVRKLFELCSPRTQRKASTIFDFPDPFGPTIALIPLGNCKIVLSANDLNPLISISRKYMVYFSFSKS